MTTYARIINNVVVEVPALPPGFTLSECFPPETAALFVQVPDGTLVGSTKNADGTFTPSAVPAPTAPTRYPVLTPIQFYLAFAPAERIAIKASTDATVKEFWATYELAAQLNSTIDMNLSSVQEGLDYLATPTGATPPGPGLLTMPRVQQILQGIPQ